MNYSRYDLAIIGGGSAGYAAASAAAAAGLEVALIERAERPEGLCILRGCMPTKALLYAAEVHHLARNSSIWGLNVPTVTSDFARVMARKDAMVEEFAAWRRHQLESGNFDWIRAQARFLDPHRIGLDSGAVITADHFLISTGSAIGPAPDPSFESAGYLTSDDALRLTERPRSLIVLGGGAIGLEFAQFFLRLGTRVQLLQRSPEILRDFDPDGAAELTKALEVEGMKLWAGTRLLSAHAEGAEKTVRFEHAGRIETTRAEAILLALGRRAQTRELGLANAGVETERDRILCNARMQTSVPHIYAAGDCAGPRQIVHVAVLQGETAAHNIAYPDQPREMNDRLSLSAVFTDPQIAQTGLSEREAQRRNLPYLSASHPFSDHGKSMIMNVKRGFVKLLAAPQSGEILGGLCLGPSGAELIHEITIALAQRLTVQELVRIPHYHPTLAEIWTYPAEELANRIPPQPASTAAVPARA